MRLRRLAARRGLDSGELARLGASSVGELDGGERYPVGEADGGERGRVGDDDGAESASVGDDGGGPGPVDHDGGVASSFVGEVDGGGPGPVGEDAVGGPRPDQLRRLAPVLGLHTSDLFAIAGQEVPDDLAMRRRPGTAGLGSLIWTLTYIPGAVPDLGALIRAMPLLPAPFAPRPPKPPHRQYPDGPGGLVVRLLENRDLGWMNAAKTMLGLGRRPALSAPTIGAIGRGTKELTPDLLIGLGAAIDIPILDLAALTGVDVSGEHRPVHPDAAEAARLFWDSRRLTAAQWDAVGERGHALRHERADELDPLMRCRCPGPQVPD